MSQSAVAPGARAITLLIKLWQLAMLSVGRESFHSI